MEFLQGLFIMKAFKFPMIYMPYFSIAVTKHMIKATYKIKHLFGAHCFRDEELMTILVVGSLAADR